MIVISSLGWVYDGLDAVTLECFWLFKSVSNRICFLVVKAYASNERGSFCGITGKQVAPKYYARNINGRRPRGTNADFQNNATFEMALTAPA